MFGSMILSNHNCLVCKHMEILFGTVITLRQLLLGPTQVFTRSELMLVNARLKVDVAPNKL